MLTAYETIIYLADKAVTKYTMSNSDQDKSFSVIESKIVPHPTVVITTQTKLGPFANYLISNDFAREICPYVNMLHDRLN